MHRRDSNTDRARRRSSSSVCSEPGRCRVVDAADSGRRLGTRPGGRGARVHAAVVGYAVRSGRRPSGPEHAVQVRRGQMAVVHGRASCRRRRMVLSPLHTPRCGVLFGARGRGAPAGIRRRRLSELDRGGMRLRRLPTAGPRPHLLGGAAARLRRRAELEGRGAAVRQQLHSPASDVAAGTDGGASGAGRRFGRVHRLPAARRGGAARRRAVRRRGRRACVATARTGRTLGASHAVDGGQRGIRTARSIVASKPRRPGPRGFPAERPGRTSPALSLRDVALGTAATLGRHDRGLCAPRGQSDVLRPGRPVR